MVQTTVADFAAELKKRPNMQDMSADKLVQQLQAAGVPKTHAQDTLSEQDKTRLLEYLARAHGNKDLQKITLTRREASEVKVADSSGKARTIQVEVKKKRTFVKPMTNDTNNPPVVASSENSPAPAAAATVVAATPAPATPSPAAAVETTPSVSVAAPPVAAVAAAAPVVATFSPAPTTTATPSKPQTPSSTPRAREHNRERDNHRGQTGERTSRNPRSNRERDGRSAPNGNNRGQTGRNTPAANVAATPPAPPRPVLDDAEIARRKADEERQAKLQAIQRAEFEARLERENRRKQLQQQQTVKETAPPAPEPAPAPVAAPVPAPTPETKSSDKPAPRAPQRERDANRSGRPNNHGSATPGQRPAPNREGRDNTRPSTRPAPAPAAVAAPAPAAAPGAGKPADKKGKKGGKDKDSWEDRRRGNGRERDDDRRQGKHKGKNRVDTTAQHAFTQPTEPIVHEVLVPETISVADLAHKMSVKATEVIKALMKLGSMVTINQVLDQETAMILVEEMGHVAKPAKLDDPEAFLTDMDPHVEHQQRSRAPVVTVMGHVDHGKTSLLDYIRRARVAHGEAGGITQHIGAYHVETERGMITFLDTPGHEAFTAMRARGAKLTDIVVLVVAADDGVMPQTAEAVAHAKAANTPLIVAVNKIDKPDANPERIRQELAARDVTPEEWGGDTMFVDVSAKKGIGIDTLLESILLQAEVMELTAPYDVPARGTVIEARLDKGRGAVATVLVQSGTLNRGDMVLVGAAYGRVRALIDEDGKQIPTAGPSIPVEILGLSDVPAAGDELVMLPDERKAREIALFRQGKFRDVLLAKKQAAKLENMFEQMSEGEVQSLPLIIKTDVQGSYEALTHALSKLSTPEVKVNILHSGVGAITESDINLAIASGAVVIGFNARADATARKLAEANDVDIRYYNIIYQAVDEIKAAMSGMLAPEQKESIIGLVEVREVFQVSKVGTIAGCLVHEGAVRRTASVRVLRNNIVVHTAPLDSLKRFKDDAKEVKAGFECGIMLKNFNDIHVGDQFEVFEMIEVARTL